MYKPNAAPNLACRMFAASHETLLWARKDKNAKHLFNYKVMKDTNFPKDKLKNEGKQMRSVWSIATPSKSEKLNGKHPTQKPLDLMERIVLSSTKKGDVVLDPFAGSSTTGVSTYKNGRKFIGFDLEKEYLNLSKKRIKDIDKV